jgi:2-oxoglutarate ferredoxin oxidoreductase subunit alpha
MYDLTIRAFNLSETYRVPTFLLADEAVAHLRESVSLHKDFEIANRIRDTDKPPFDTEAPDGVPPMPAFGDGANLMVTGSTHDEWGYRRVDHPEIHTRLVSRINRKILDHQDQIVEVDKRQLDDAQVGIVAYGFSARSSLAAVSGLRNQGVQAGLLRLKTIWPFPEKEVAALGSRAKVLLVPEMNQGQVAGLVRASTNCEVVSLCQTDGEVIEPEHIVQKAREVLK